MTVGEIAQDVAAYLQRDYGSFAVGSRNLILNALNRARKAAERRHDFSICRQKGYFLVTNKVLLESPTWWGGDGETLRKGKYWWLRESGVTASEFGEIDTPLRVITAGVKYQLDVDRWYDQGLVDRYPSDRRERSIDDPLLGQTHGIIRDKWLELHPVSTDQRMVVVDGYKWWNDWTEGEQRVRFEIPEEVFVSLADESYLNLNMTTDSADNTTQRQIKLWLDDAGTGQAVAADANVANVMLDATAFTTTNCIAAWNKFGLEAELVDGIVYVYITGPDPTCVVTLYSAGAAAIIYDQGATGTVVSAANDASDWWTEHADEYLLWGAIVEVNKKLNIFTGNREGNLPEPKREKEMALEALIQNDIDGSEGANHIF